MSINYDCRTYIRKVDEQVPNVLLYLKRRHMFTQCAVVSKEETYVYMLYMLSLRKWSKEETYVYMLYMSLRKW